MEAPIFNEDMERPATHEEREYVQRALFQYGAYAAMLDDMPNPPEAPQSWAEKPCIIPSDT